MEASAKTIRKILESGDQFLVPFFQRSYAWTRKHWERLRSDVWALADDDGDSQHFLGPLVCTLAKANPGEVPSYQLIDGQQRLTTLTMMLAALRDVADDLGFKKLAAKVHEGYLIHRHEEGLQRYKVVPRTGDREVLIAIIERQVETPHKRTGVYRAWRFFRKHVADFARADAPEARLSELFSAIADRLSLVAVTISGENPYEIFESLNSTGLPLEESDLIRNFVFMQVDMTAQDKFNEQHWKKFESVFDETDADAAIPATAFYRNYLMRGGTYSKAKATFVDFKRENRERDLPPDEQVAELRRFAEYELVLRRPTSCADAALRRHLTEIAQLEITTAHPLLMTLMDRHAQGSLTDDELCGCLDDLASFVLRRSVCGESTRNYGRWFCEAIRAIKGGPRDDLRGYWFRRGWPDDAAFLTRLQEFPIYRREPKKARLILMAMENSYSPKEHVDPSTLTLEHVMPQTIGDSKSGKAWQAALGEDWFMVHEALKHTLGNLTLTGYNQELGNRSFEDKRAALETSKMLLNKPIVALDEWNGRTIAERGDRLAREVAERWPRPEAGPDYIAPTNDDEDDEAGDLSTYKQRRLRYWTAFCGVLKERGNGLTPKALEATTSLEFPIGIENGFLWTWFVGRRREISVGLTLRRRRGRAIYKGLLEAKDEIEREVGEPLQWDSPICSISEQGYALRDEDEWSEQHDWMADKLERLYRALGPRVKQLDAQAVSA